MVQACWMGWDGFPVGGGVAGDADDEEIGEPGALQERAGKGRGFVGDHAERQAERAKGLQTITHAGILDGLRPLKPL